MMAIKMLQKRGNAADWAAQNPILGDGEIGFERDTKTIKLGDGVTPWNDLTTEHMPKAGGIFTGPVTMPEATMTGPLTLVAPTLSSHAARLSDITPVATAVTTIESTLSSLQHGLLDVVKFTSNGDFIKDDYPTLRLIKATFVGGGGAGQGSDADSNEAGGGGGGGGTVIAIFSVGDLAESEPVVIGVGGAYVTGSGAGSPGGSTTFKSVTAGGGGYGSDINALGGSASGGLLNIKGGAGLASLFVSDASASASGGSSMFGHGGVGIDYPGIESIHGTNGDLYGGGGGGAFARFSGSPSVPARHGGAGANGVAIFELYA